MSRILLFLTAFILSFTAVNSWAQNEEELGPWLDLTGGGISTGPAQGKENQIGGLINGTLFPAQGKYFRRISSPSESYGSGMMVSLLRNATAYFGIFIWPGYVTSVGEIARQNGGVFPPHSSHQNGLDADIPFIGTRTYESVVGSDGKVTAKFLPEQNWEFWRLLYRQRVLRNGSPTSVVSMILVGPAVKTYLCEWAKANNMLSNPENLQIMNRVRPTVGHDDHFHLRLHCSPHHTQCVSGNISASVCP